MSSTVENSVRIIRTQDRVELTEAQVLKILKDHIEKATGRNVQGQVTVSKDTRGRGMEVSASCTLVDEVK